MQCGGNTMSWGYHLVLDVKSCKEDTATDFTFIKSSIEDLVGVIGMTAFGECVLKHFGDGKFDSEGKSLAGWTAIQLIETSNIIAHFCDETGDAYIDIFSCQEFDHEIASNFIKERFDPLDIKSMFLERQA